jgi:hypothetical protein
MKMRRFVVVVTAVLVAMIVAYYIGYWPQRRQVAQFESEVTELRERIADLEARDRAAALLGDLLNLTDTVMRKDYGRAQQLSSAFFDRVRAEAANSPIPSLRSGFSSILATRDAVTGGLARSDEQVTQTLQELQVEMRMALGFTILPAQTH